jgi:hypothetical protein
MVRDNLEYRTLSSNFGSAVLFIRAVDFRDDLPAPIPLPNIPLPDSGSLPGVRRSWQRNVRHGIGKVTVRG